jgi:hypothetical protein
MKFVGEVTLRFSGSDMHVQKERESDVLEPCPALVILTPTVLSSRQLLSFVAREGRNCSPSSPVRAVLLSFVAREGCIALLRRP